MQFGHAIEATKECSGSADDLDFFTHLVTLRVRKLDDGGARIDVEDSGIGIQPEDVDKLFQAFSQVHDKMEKTRSGTGLGLYIAKGIVDSHGGEIRCQSAGLGKGCTFWFTLPAIAKPAQL